jgi:hypothetical protein
MLSHSNDRTLTERCAILARLSGQRREHGRESRVAESQFLGSLGAARRKPSVSSATAPSGSHRVEVRAAEPSLTLRD